MVPARLASSVVQRHVKHVVPVPASAATGLVSRVYAQVSDEMRLVIPPALLHSPVPELLAAYWMLMRESLLVVDGVDRAAKETVAAAVSVANMCPYCVEMHSVSMYELTTEQDAEAVAADRPLEMSDPRLRELSRWARTAHESGPDGAPGAAAASGFEPGARAELIGVVVAMHYLTRMVNVFLSNFLLPPGLGPRARRRFKRVASRILRPTLRSPRAPGRSLPLLPTADLAPDADWAAGRPAIAGAVGAAYAAFERAGHRCLSARVRNLVTERLAGWKGEETGLSTAWCEDLVTDVPAADRAAARLALLTAFASYQVDEEVIRRFRRHHPGDRALIEVTAWASFAAARIIGARLGSAMAGETGST